MNKNFEKAKDELAQHLLRIDLDKLSISDLSAYSAMICQLNMIYAEKQDYFSRAYELMNSGICAGQKAKSAPLKEA